MKREFFWIGILSLLGAGIVWGPQIFGWQAFYGFGGLVIMFFLAYCAIILVAQVFSALQALRTLAEDMVKQRTSQQVQFRSEQSSNSPEE